MNLISDHVKELVELQQLTPNTFKPVPNDIDPDKYWRYFSKFPNEFAKGLRLALNTKQEFVTYDHLANVLTIK